MDDFAELRRRERAQAALQRIHREYGKDCSWSGTSTPTKRTPQLTETSSSFFAEHVTSLPTQLKSSESGQDE